jgi:hypothetical protein
MILDALMLALLVGAFVATFGYACACQSLTAPERQLEDRQP